MGRDCAINIQQQEFLVKKEMGQYWLLVFQLVLIWVEAVAAASPPPISLPGCRDTCGEVAVPYPFGIGDRCRTGTEASFNLTCNETFHPPKPFLGGSGFEVLNISLEGQVWVNTYVASDCDNATYNGSGWDSRMSFPDSWPFTFSNTHNKFTALGCDTRAYITGSLLGSNKSFTSGCMSFCSDKESVVNDTCSGIGCCQTSIPRNAKWFKIEVHSPHNHTGLLEFNPCSYAFLIDQERFKFNEDNLFINGTYKTGGGRQAPVVVDWTIGNKTCESASKKLDAYACKSANSTCYEPNNGTGYRCNCSKGFAGNPYMERGCTDIDECQTGTHNCTVGEHCINEEGSFSCKRIHNVQLIVIILGVGSGLFFVLMACALIYWGFQKRKLLILREKYFQKNGGLLLQQQICSNGVAVTTKIFSEEVLKRATNNYDEAQIVGRGGNGTVYKGLLPDHTIVAIKKSKIVDQTQIEDFINEVVILSQINHRNVVKLLGCCLETSVPLLVYEYISNGTLYQHIHDKALSSSLSLENRLRISSETAGALDYLHFAASIPIFHRDVKSTNILLDDNLTAKVSDFGASRLVPLDQTQLSTLVQGTLGYLDPEYFQTGQLTEKSDVYSFGVVLVELLTGEKPICANRSQEERNLSNYFLLSMKDNHLFQVLENRVVDEGGVEQLVAVAELAKRCLKINGEDRPTMKEVAMELEGLRKFVEHPWVERNHEETQSLLGDLSVEAYSGNGNVTGQDSLTLNNHNMNALEIGR